MEDGIIGGYFVPKDSIIIANLWGMMHDPEIYPDPFRFDPSRHISSPGNLPFYFYCNSLALFDILKRVENGIPITPVHENTSRIISYPKPLKCEIKPRSETAILEEQ
ncbi:cytochrome P450 [Infundibulicybe gibba]|nr:cytochrome P450 [Infundibulicybe gibba]